MAISNNTTKLQEILNTINTLPDANEGVKLPELTNEGTSNDLLSGKELIDSEGNIVTGTIPSQEAKTITPSTSSQTAVASGVYTTGEVTVAAIPSQYITTTDATAEANDIMDGETAYVNGNKITGTFTIDNEIFIQNNLITQLQEVANNLPEASEGGIGLPKLTNEGTSNDLLSGKELIDSKGNIVTGTIPSQTATTYTPTTTNQTIASGTYLAGTQTIAGDSNLVAENIKNGVSIFGVEGTLEEGSGSSEIVEYSEAEDAMVTGTLSTYTNDRVTKIGAGAFAYCTSLMSVSFPTCTYIGAYAFNNCSSLTTVSFPACKNIGYGAFEYCSSLTSVSFSACSHIGGSAFYYCTSLTSVSFPACTYIGVDAFNNCSSLTSVNFPACKNIDNNAFQYCSSLTSVSFPVCTSINRHAFRNCRSLTSASFPACTSISYGAFYCCFSLTSVNFPICTSIGSNTFSDCISLTSVSFPACASIGISAFYNCTSLTSVSFPACTNISGYAFSRCYNLISLYLTGSSLCTLSRSDAFYSTPIGGYSTSAGQYGSIYVPTSLLTSYQTATNWTYFSSRFVGIDTNIDDSSNLITFTIDGTEYQAEDGMTWGEWCDSEYNTHNFSPYGYTNGGALILSPLDNTKINENHILISNGAYITILSGEAGA